MKTFLDRTTDPITDAIIASAMEVHRTLGPGLLESAYAECLAYEFSTRSIRFSREVPLHIVYRAARIALAAYRIDFVVQDSVVVEVKAQERLAPVHRSQLLTYLRLGRYSRGLLLNFGEARLATGIKRVVNNWEPDSEVPITDAGNS